MLLHLSKASKDVSVWSGGEGRKRIDEGAFTGWKIFAEHGTGTRCSLGYRGMDSGRCWISLLEQLSWVKESDEDHGQSKPSLVMN